MPDMGATSLLGSLSSVSSSITSSHTITTPVDATEFNRLDIGPLDMPCPNTAGTDSFDGGDISTSTSGGFAANLNIASLANQCDE